MVAKIIIEQAMYQLQGGSPPRDSSFEYQDFFAYFKQLLGDYIKKNLFENKNDGFNDIDGQFVFTFDAVPIKYNSSRNLFYSELPSAYITLPHEAGVDMVCLMKSQNKPFIKVQRNFLSASRGLPISDLEGNYGYWTEGNNIYYANMGDPVDSVMMRLVAAMDAIDDTVSIGMPADAEKFIVDSLIAHFQPQLAIPVDKLNDGAPINSNVKK